ncbi:hypothetical protein GMDG_07891 [Pseudogymnoascus destructans 20631-21]|uniref:Uncharacterized protein n=1 Tax=Pseudogymnoascus destructans (strain ATCC MYA-4855 / 20631-21) TaxID=658429 RepID=L8FZ61_PSED2|nr:hypothetical protein GMDG_07891 [Pseudogymnoascus destructans 20631-21]
MMSSFPVIPRLRRPRARHARPPSQVRMAPQARSCSSPDCLPRYGHATALRPPREHFRSWWGVQPLACPLQEARHPNVSMLLQERLQVQDGAEMHPREQHGPMPVLLGSTLLLLAHESSTHPPHRLIVLGLICFRSPSL